MSPLFCFLFTNYERGECIMKAGVGEIRSVAIPNRLVEKSAPRHCSHQPHTKVPFCVEAHVRWRKQVSGLVLIVKVAGHDRDAAWCKEIIDLSDEKIVIGYVFED